MTQAEHNDSNRKEIVKAVFTTLDLGAQEETEEKMEEQYDQRHPEDKCGRCGGMNVVWFAPNDLWNAHHGRFNILCPSCFVLLCDYSGYEKAWLLTPELEAEQNDPGAQAVRELREAITVLPFPLNTQLKEKSEPVITLFEQAQKDLLTTRQDRDDADKAREQAQRERDDLTAKCERLEAACAQIASAAVCAHCGKPATCIGRYEEPTDPDVGFACDNCCGHGNEDGWCKPLSDCGQPFLDERDRLRKALKSIAEGDPHGPSGATAREALATPGKEGE